jgi:beta-phosphoglucomutase
MTGIDAIIFDFDGVIADSERLHMRAFQQTLGGIGLEMTDSEYYADLLGWTDRQIFEHFVGDADAPRVDSLMRDKSCRYDELCAKDEILYPDAASAIRRLASSRLLAVASGALTHEIHRTLERAGLLGCFRTLVGAEAVTQGKPAPAPYLEAARRLGVPPARCVAIEDSPWGLQSARAAGMWGIGVTNTYGPDRLTDADVVVTSLDEIDDGLLARFRRDA